jgi:hypothetical protein
MGKVPVVRVIPCADKLNAALPPGRVRTAGNTSKTNEMRALIIPIVIYMRHVE